MISIRKPDFSPLPRQYLGMLCFPNVFPQISDIGNVFWCNFMEKLLNSLLLAASCQFEKSFLEVMLIGYNQCM